MTVWDKKGEHLAEHLAKGMRVIVTGEERIREFEKKDGSKGQSLELNARDVGIVPKMNNSNSGGNNYQQQSQSWGAEHQPTTPQNDPWAASNNSSPF